MYKQCIEIKNVHNSALVKPNLFIFGSERSGTTLLCALLSEHPDIFVLNDSFIFDIYTKTTNIKSPSNYVKHLVYSLLSPLPKRTFTPSSAEKEKYISELVSRYNLPNPGSKKASWLKYYGEILSSSHVIDTIKKHELTITEVFDIIYSQLVPKENINKLFLGEKTPSHLYLSPWLKNLYPEAKTITLIRNPISNIASIHKYSTSKDINYAINKYLSFYGTKYQLLFKKNNNNILIRYEDLIHNKDKVLSAIYKFLNVNSSSNSEEFSYFIKSDYVGKKIDPTRDIKLRQSLSEEQKKLIRKRCKSIYTQFYQEDI